MMTTEFSRTVILEKMEQLMKRSLPPYEVYQWCLGFILAKGFEQFSSSDPAAAQAVQTLLKINEDHKVSEKELRILEYHRQCLSGRKPCDTRASDFDYPPVPPDILGLWKEEVPSEASPDTEPFTRGKILHWLRIYVYVFAGFVLLSSFWKLLSWGAPGAAQRSRAMLTYPFFVYGGLLVLPMQVLTQKKIFLVTLVLSILALAYFWFSFFQLIFSDFFHWIGVLAGFFLGAVPATVSVWLLVYERYLKNRTVMDSE